MPELPSLQLQTFLVRLRKDFFSVLAASSDEFQVAEEVRISKVKQMLVDGLHEVAWRSTKTWMEGVTSAFKDLTGAATS